MRQAVPIRFLPVELKVLLLIFVVFHPSICERNFTLKSSNNKLIILSYDGFRFDYLDKTYTPNIDKLKASGVYARYINPQFITKTFPNHQSIATGLYVESHGIVDNALFDPEYGKIVSGYGVGDREYWNFNDEITPIWIWNELSGDGRISGVQWPGSDTPYGPNLTLPTHGIQYKKSRTFEARVDCVINWLIHPENPANLVMMYFDEPDGQGHKFGPDSPEVVKAIERMDQVTGYLIDQLKSKKIFEETNIILLSDHGFEEVSLRKVVNISALLSPPEDYYTIYGKSPVLQLLPVEGKLDEIYNTFKSASMSLSFSIYKKEEIPLNWHYGDNRRIMPLLLVADPGYVFDDYAKYLRKKLNLTEGDELNPSLVYGAHGYDSRSVNMRPFFVAHGPDFKRGAEIKPFDNVDLFPLFCKLLGISTPPNNGSFENIQELLKSETTENEFTESSHAQASIALGLKKLHLGLTMFVVFVVVGM